MVRFEGHIVTRCVLLTWATTVAGEISNDKEGIKGSNALWGLSAAPPWHVLLGLVSADW
jgi:hypothetical protein